MIGRAFSSPTAPLQMAALEMKAGRQFNQGRYAEAAENYRRLLELKRPLYGAVLGEEYTMIPAHLAKLGECLSKQGEYQEAAKCFAEQVEMLRRLSLHAILDSAVERRHLRHQRFHSSLPDAL